MAGSSLELSDFSLVQCCVPFCDSADKTVHLGLYAIQPHWIPAILDSDFISKENTSSVYGGKICANHYKRCGIKEQVLNTQIHYPYLGISVSKFNRDAHKNHVFFHSDDVLVGSEITFPQFEDTTTVAQMRSCTKSSPKIKHNDHSYALNARHVKILKEDYDKAKTENEFLQRHIVNLEDKYQMEIDRLKKLNHDLIAKQLRNEANKVEQPFRNITQSPATLKFYTGFNDRQTFDYFAALIRPLIEHARFQENANQDKSIRKRNFDFQCQLCMVLVKLRLDLPHTDLSFRFNISATTISNYWNQWVEILLDVLPKESHKLDPVPENEIRRVFLEYEQILIMQKIIQIGQRLYSRGKSLLHLTPRGFVVFASDIYPSHIADKDIIHLEEPGVQDEPYDVSADPEVIQQLHRILVIIRGYKILRGIFNKRTPRKEDLNKVWKICCLLANFTMLQVKEEDSQLN